MSFGKEKSASNSGTSSSADYGSYWGTLNDVTGGRLSEFAQGGTKPLSVDEIKSFGGMGETRRADVNAARSKAIEDMAADPSLSVAQKLRARQLTDNDANARLDAIAKETEAAIAAAAQANNALPAADLETLAKIFYGGKGQNSSSQSSGWRGSFWG